MSRIAIVLPNMGGGGAERVALTLIGNFVRRGFDVDLVLMRAEGELLALVPPEVHVVDLNANRNRGALRPLVRYLRQRRPNAVQARMWPLTAIAIIAARLSGIGARVVVSDHSTLSSQYSASPRTLVALRLTTRWLYPLANARLCVSSGVADDLAKISGLPRDTFVVVNNPANAPPTQLKTEPEVERLWAGACKRILTVGSLKEPKNHPLLIRAFALLDKSMGAHLMIVGEGLWRRELERLAGALGVADRVILPGFAAEPWPYYASAQLFVLSSDREGYPNVLIEAMIAGLPLVSTDCSSGPREILDGGRFGRLVPCGNAEALAGAMVDALAGPHDPEIGRRRASQLSADAIQRYEELLIGACTAQ